MSDSGRNFELTKERKLAARLLWEDDLTDEDISEQVGISPRTLYRWKGQPEFRAEIKRLGDEWAATVMSVGVAKRENRVAALNDRWELLKQVVIERAAWYAAPDDSGDDDAEPIAPGAGTGLMVKQVKSVGFGENNMVITEWVVDTGTLAELRAIEQQAAKETGQWLDKSESKLTVDMESAIRKLADRHGVTVDAARATVERAKKLTE